MKIEVRKQVGVCVTPAKLTEVFGLPEEFKEAKIINKYGDGTNKKLWIELEVLTEE